MPATEAHDRRAMREVIAAELLGVAKRYAHGTYYDEAERADAAAARDVYTAAAMRVLVSAADHGGALSEVEAQAFVRARRTPEADVSTMDL